MPQKETASLAVATLALAISFVALFRPVPSHTHPGLQEHAPIVFTETQCAATAHAEQSRVMSSSTNFAYNYNGDATLGDLTQMDGLDNTTLHPAAVFRGTVVIEGGLVIVNTVNKSSMFSALNMSQVQAPSQDTAVSMLINDGKGTKTYWHADNNTCQCGCGFPLTGSGSRALSVATTDTKHVCRTVAPVCCMMPARCSRRTHNECFVTGKDERACLAFGCAWNHTNHCIPVNEATNHTDTVWPYDTSAGFVEFTTSAYPDTADLAVTRTVCLQHMRTVTDWTDKNELTQVWNLLQTKKMNALTVPMGHDEQFSIRENMMYQIVQVSHTNQSWVPYTTNTQITTFPYRMPYGAHTPQMEYAGIILSIDLDTPMDVDVLNFEDTAVYNISLHMTSQTGYTW